jgi:hypothetical protein
MRLHFLIGVAAVTGCDYQSGPLPNNADVARVDRALSQVPCIGKPELWQREYQYRTTLRNLPVSLWWLDRNTIDFHLTKAGEFADAGVHPKTPDPPFARIVDDTPTDLAWGSYNLRSGRLQMDFCGPNFPSS